MNSRYAFHTLGRIVPPATGHHRVLRQPPAELLGDLEAVGLGALGVVRAQVDVDDRPAVLVGDLGAQPVDVVVVAADLHEPRPEHERRHDLARLEVVGNEDDGAEPRGGGVGRDGVGEVAGRGAADGVEAELDRARDGHRDHAVLVAEGRVVGAVVLEVELAHAQLAAQALGPHERREARAQAGPRLALDRQQVAVAPERARPRLDPLAGHDPAHRGVVVAHLDGAEALVADHARGDGVRRPAFLAGQATNEAHRQGLWGQTSTSGPTGPLPATRRGRRPAGSAAA